MKQIQIFKTDNPRLFLFYPIFFLLFCALIAGLAWRQIIQKESFESQEVLQSMRRILNPGTRGNIYDRNGKLLVGNRPVFSAVAYLGALKDDLRKEYYTCVKLAKQKHSKIDFNAVRKEARLNVLQRHLDTINSIIGRNEKIKLKDLERHFSQRLLLPFPLIQDLSPEEYARLTEQIPVDAPIQLFTDSARYYPYGPADAHVLGYVGTTLNIPEDGVPGKELTTFSLRGKVGKAGMEAFFDEKLQGTSGGDVWKVDPVGYQFQHVAHKAASQGAPIITSIDIDLQLTAEKALGDHTGAVVVLDVNTGEVLTMVSHPTYDLNELTPFIPQATYEAINDKGAWLNRATQGLYPPGSPFKLITTIAGMKANLIDEHTITDCKGKHYVGNRAFHCDRRSGHGLLNVEESIAKSCNILFYQTSLDIGNMALAEQAREFGLGEPTGIEIPFESSHTLVPDSDWKQNKQLGKWMPGDTTNMSIGQGYLLSTPLQMACFMASLARGETRTYPTLIHAPENHTQSSRQKSSPIGLSQEQYQMLLNGMEKATLEGTARRATLSNVRIASKTGTSQAWYQGKRRNIAWHAGFAPADNPTIAIVVMVEETEDDNNYGGGRTTSPIAKKVLRKALLSKTSS